MADEFGRLPDEIITPPEEYRSLQEDEYKHPKVRAKKSFTEDEATRKKHRKKLMGMITSAAVSVTVLTNTGAGIIPDTQNVIEHQVETNCFICDGTGVCAECNGDLYVKCEVAEAACELCHGTGTRLCEKCMGTGKCIICDGTGISKNR